MISLTSIPERIIFGETLKVKLSIEGRINLSMYKNSYFNLIIKKNGGTLGSTTLYPLKFNGFDLEWEVNPFSYSYDGTFNVDCVIQNTSNPITNTTFIVEPDCIVKKVNTCNNITSIEQMKKFKESQIKKQEIPIDYTGGCLIERPNANPKLENTVKKLLPIDKTKEDFSNYLISSGKIQSSAKNVNGK